MGKFPCLKRDLTNIDFDHAKNNLVYKKSLHGFCYYDESAKFDTNDGYGEVCKINDKLAR